MGRIADLTKRGADVVLSAVALALSVPFWVWAMLAITLSDGWPFLYSQTRVGLNGRVFRIYKFRSMVRHAEKYTGAIFSHRGDPRVTRVGRIMRSTAIDEIPQLLSIFRGDMSWVGPRPERPEEAARNRRVIARYDLRHTVRPGLTGMAQVHGSNYADAHEKLRLDLYYVKHRGLLLDLKLYVRSWANTVLGKWEAARARRDGSDAIGTSASEGGLGG